MSITPVSTTPTLFPANTQSVSMILGSILALRSPSQTQVSTIFANLKPFTPHLESVEVERLEKLLKKLFSFFPNELSKEQAELTTQLGTWYLQNKDPLKAMHYFAYALQREPVEERHRHTSEVFLQWALINNTFKGRLEKAYSEGDVGLFNQLMDSLHKMQRFFYHERDFHILSEVVNDVLIDDPKENRMEQFSLCAEKLHSLLPPPLATEPVTIHYQRALQIYRQHCTLEHYKAFFNLLLDDALTLLGRPPCRFDIRAMGSLARNEPAPYSDLEYFILIEDAKHRTYFQQLAEVIALQFLSLGETDFPVLTITEGIHIDPGANPARHPDLIGTPQEMAERKTPNHNEELRLTLFQSVSLLESPPDLSTEFQKTLDPKEVRQRAFEACVSLKEHFETQWNILPTQLQEFSLKEQFILPLNVLLDLLHLYHGNLENKFTPSTLALIKEVSLTLHQVRIRVHLKYQQHNDQVKRSDLQVTEQQILDSAYWLLLRPLYNTFDKIITQSEINLPIEALNELIKEPDVRSLKLFLPHLAGHLAKHGDLEVHIQVLVALQDLHSFRHLYLSVLEKEGVNITSLAKHPARNGIRYAEVQDIRYMADALQHITTDDPASGVMVQHSAIGRRYLHPDVAKQILDESGNIMEVESGCRHRVASAEYSPFHLFFKQKPNHPMMEYAIHSLSYKTVGKSTPPTELVRFEVNGKAYPVLISQAIEGSTLKMASAVDINRASLTRMLLMSILTRPGDGLDSNYIIDDQGNIFCIDNDISFVEPVEKTLMGPKINFSSILFCFDQELLDPATLEAFTMLSPEDILHCWMTELIIKEQEYLALFSKDECAELYKEDKQGNRFTPSLLLKEGTTPTLCHQFDHLQRELIENNYQMTAQDLLKTLVSLGSEVGESVALRYSGAFTRRNRTPQERLKSVTGATQSMTSGNGFKASLGSIPSTGDIEKRKLFSLEEAKDELFPLIEQVLGGKYIKFDEKHRVLHVSFEKTDRHETVLKVAAKKVGAYGVPTELSLRGCKKISLSTLGPFLSDELRFLDLRNCPNLKSDMMELIAKKCPSLEELYLSSTEIEVVAEQTRFGQTRPLRMPNLKTLHISRCKNLRMIKLESPCLVHFKAKDNPMLREADLEAVMPIIDGSPCKPRTVWRDINIDLLKKILPLFPSTVFVDNQYIYGILTDRLSESEIQKIFEPQNDCLTQLDLENNSIGAAGAQALAQVLPQTQITQLNLYNNYIGATGAQAIAQVLKKTKITQLNLGRNYIGDAGVQALAQGLHQTKITQLDLRDNKIGDAGVQALAQGLHQTKITQLDLGDNSIGEEGAQALAQVLPQTQITRLDLGDNSIGEEGAQALAQVLPQTQITRLGLAINFIGDAGAQALAQVLPQTQITQLDLSWNFIRDAGTQALAQELAQIKITELDLSDELRFLDLRNCSNLKSNMMELIAKKCPSLEELYLSDSGIEVLAEIPLLGQARPLRMPNLKTLHISRCKNLKMIKLESPCLVHFKAKDNPMLREADLEAVMPIIDGSPCKPRTVWRDINIDLLKKILPLFPSTVFVDNQYIYGILTDRLSESEIQKIFEPQNDCLTQLDLKNIGDAGAQALAKVLPQTKITQLNLGNNDIEAAGAQALAQVLPQTQISQLDLRDNKIGEASAQAIAQVLPQTQITELNLRGNSIGDAGAQAIAQVLPQTQITQLNLERNFIGEAGAQAIAQVLPQTQISQLNLSENHIRDAGAQALAQVLPQTQIAQLDLDHNSIEEVGAQALAQVLPQTQISQLNLSWNYIGDAGAQALAQVLPQTQISQLNLERNLIGDAGAQALAQVLPQTQISQLNLERNLIGDAGAQALAQVLPQTQISQLNLGGNSIGEAGAQAIAQVLPQTQITQLNLRDNNIGDAGAQALAQVLPQTQITQLDLGRNSIEDAGAQAIAQVLKKTQITQLNLKHNLIRKAGRSGYSASARLKPRSHN